MTDYCAGCNQTFGLAERRVSHQGRTVHDYASCRGRVDKRIEAERAARLRGGTEGRILASTIAG